MCSGTLVAAQRRAMLPVFGGISGSTNATVIIDFNTTNDSWWMFHFQPTTKTHSTFEYHQPTVGGGFISNPQQTPTPPSNTTNDSWWMFHFQPTTNTHSTFEYHQRQLVDVSLPTYNKHPLHFRI